MVTVNRLVSDWVFSDRIGEYNTIVIHLMHALYPMIIGGLLAIPYLVRTLNKTGKVNYDLPRSLALGIPTFFLAMNELISYLPVFFSRFIVLSIPDSKLYSEVLVISGVIFGYVLVTSINKTEVEE